MPRGKDLLAMELTYSVKDIRKALNQLIIVPTEDLQGENIAKTRRYLMTNQDKIFLKVEGGMICLCDHVKNRYS